MFEKTWHPREAWLPLVAGWCWLGWGSAEGGVGFFLTVLPGTLLLSGGTAMLLLPGDARTTHFTALGAFVGALLALPAALVVGIGTGLVLFVLAAASAIAAGASALRLEPNTDEVPEPALGPLLHLQVAVDEALLATMMPALPLPKGGEFARIAMEAEASREFLRARGWLESPADYHLDPPKLDDPRIHRSETRGVSYEHVTFESGYEPHEGEPGRERWLGYAPNRSVHAWLLRHPEEGRPWLVAVHGYQMGWPLIDLLAFDPSILRDRLGMNLLLPVLPLHGPRKIGRRSGDGYLRGDIVDSQHAVAQAMWDIRRLLSWVRASTDAPIGTLGYSLGGYTAALLAAIDADLACVIAGIPATDFTRLFYRHGPPIERRGAEAAGANEDSMREALRVVSPLDLVPRVPRERRYVFGAVADRLVPPDQVRDLWLHWDRPRIEWYQGAHVTFRAHPKVQRFVDEALRESGLAR